MRVEAKSKDGWKLVSDARCVPSEGGSFLVTFPLSQTIELAAAPNLEIKLDGLEAESCIAESCDPTIDGGTNVQYRVEI